MRRAGRAGKAVMFVMFAWFEVRSMVETKMDSGFLHLSVGNFRSARL